ncbi:MAG: 1-acyl-sn-glycerol-3-phosphate acyltransferase, partial [Bacteroidales bacterium]|nr:1-acyl-sn-glycerol-3-phosphate acyltransferase [Bacteroidales bacterium]
MVYFNIVEKRSIYYRFWRRWFGRFFSAVYYRKFVVQGTENLPPVGTPYMIVSNHQNGLLDALCILFGLPERHTPIFLARSDIFKKPFVAKLLCFCKILPIYRQRDGKEQLGKNEAIFDFAARMIGEGAAVSLFPEGHHQEGHYLGRFKKGFARIAFDAAERKCFPADMLVVPAANHYVRYRGHRTEAMLMFGKPVRLADYYAAYRENPVRAMVLLAEELETRVRGMMLDMPYPERYAALDAWRELARDPGLTDVEAMFRADKAWADRVRALPEAEVERACATAVAVSAQLRQKGFSPSEWPVKVKIKDLLTRALCLVIYAPFALAGLLLTAVPFGISWHFAGKFSKAAKTDMLFSTFHFTMDM